MDDLIDIPVLSLQVTAAAHDAIGLPEMAGSSLRGAFGSALKRLVCVRRDLLQCAPCPIFGACAYPYLFETRAPDAPGAVGFESSPRPYVFRSPPGERILQPGEMLQWEMTLIGRAIGFFPYVALAWQEMGRAGIGRGQGRFVLEHVAALYPDGSPAETLYKRENNLLHDPETILGPDHFRAPFPGAKSVFPARPEPSASGNGSTVELEFVAPTSLKHQGKRVSTPEFHVVWRNLQRRLSMLRLAHGEGRPEMDFAAAIARAETVRLLDWKTRPLSWERYSYRQGQRVPMQGLTGRARYSGDLAPFLPAIRLGSLVGVGDNCTFGQGQYRVVSG